MTTNIQESPPVTIQPMTKSEPNSNSNGTSIQETGVITAFVTSLGKLLLKEKTRDWLDMEAAAKLCKTEKLELDGEIPGSAQLEATLRRVLEPSSEFYAPGLVLDGYPRRRGWALPFLIKVYHQTTPVREYQANPK